MKETTNWERVARKIKDDIQDAFEGIEREDDPEYPKFLNGFLLKGVKGTVDKRHRWHPSLESYEQLRDELKQEENLLPFAEYFVRSLDEGFARYNEYKDKGFSKTFKLGWFTAHWANENGLARPRRTGGTVGSRIEDLSRSLCMAPALSFLFSADSCAGRSTPRNSAFRSFLSGRTFAEHRTSILRQPCRRSMHCPRTSPIGKFSGTVLCIQVKGTSAHIVYGRWTSFFALLLRYTHTVLAQRSSLRSGTAHTCSSGTAHTLNAGTAHTHI